MDGTLGDPDNPDDHHRFLAQLVYVPDDPVNPMVGDLCRKTKNVVSVILIVFVRVSECVLVYVRGCFRERGCVSLCVRLVNFGGCCLCVLKKRCSKNPSPNNQP